MAIRTILKDEDPVLRKRTRAVTDFSARISELLDDMRDTLEEANGLGLAAPQVGILRKAAIIVDGEEIVELLNPELIDSEGEVGMDEGCLSFPGKYGYVRRPQKVTVKAQDRNGRPFTREFADLSARAACHEIDHLNGILFIDLVEEPPEDYEEDAKGQDNPDGELI
ncbi:MAG: peptide deformylase [Ruminococcaceae bacterium]|nr:peptide deformylase [Oscillospiraceae bacterium]